MPPSGSWREGENQQPYINKSVRLYNTCLQYPYVQTVVWKLLFSVYEHSVTETHHTGNWERQSLKGKKRTGNEEKEREGIVERGQLCSGKGTKLIHSPEGIPQRIRSRLSRRLRVSPELSLLPLLAGHLGQRRKRRYVLEYYSLSKSSAVLKVTKQ